MNAEKDVKRMLAKLVVTSVADDIRARLSSAEVSLCETRGTEALTNEEKNMSEAVRKALDELETWTLNNMVNISPKITITLASSFFGPMVGAQKIADNMGDEARV